MKYKLTVTVDKHCDEALKAAFIKCELDEQYSIFYNAQKVIAIVYGLKAVMLAKLGIALGMFLSIHSPVDIELEVHHDKTV